MTPFEKLVAELGADHPYVKEYASKANQVETDAVTRQKAARDARNKG
jgi:hypothetical protein